MTAADIVARLRRRYPATQSMGVRTVPGPWTCIEEMLGCDLLAIAAHKRPVNGPLGVNNPRVGLEVKVSRADYRKELRAPHKRAEAVSLTHAFYLAVPAGLLKPTELVLRRPSGDDERTLWVPEDVGLVVVDGRGCRVAAPSPVRTEPAPIDGALFGICARYISSHPDPRHEGLVEADRALRQRYRDEERDYRERWRSRAAGSV